MIKATYNKPRDNTNWEIISIKIRNESNIHPPLLINKSLGVLAIRQEQKINVPIGKKKSHYPLFTHDMTPYL